MFVDLHIHSNYSDGSDSCNTILQNAIYNNVHSIAITDHNSVSSCKKINELLDPRIKIISGVEFDAKFDGSIYHILGFGINYKNRKIQDACIHNQIAQESYNSDLIKAISKDISSISIDEYNDYTQPSCRGGWKVLNYLLDKNLTKNLIEGKKFYKEYGFSYNNIDFLTLDCICNAITTSGGVPILAHPVENIPYDIYSKEFANRINRILEHGVCGIECIHPLQSQDDEKFLIDLCKKEGLFITGGTDYHGSFVDKQKQKIGEQFVPYDLVKKLIEKVKI